MDKVNREYKDRLFKFIFGNPENKAWTLSLYNAVNNSSYTDPEEIQLTTLEDAVYMGMKNDISFLIGDAMNFYEQQSSLNPNMPARFFNYTGVLYGRYIDDKANNYHKFSSTLQKLPTPKCICFYNGIKETEDRVILKLSDAFAPGSDPDIELRVTMININYGHNKELMEACRPLKEYAWFIDKVRANQKEMDSLEQAIDAAIAELDDEALIKPFLLKNQSEVKAMYITEYDEARTLAETREESYEEGKSDGIIQTLISLVKDGILTLAEAAKRAGMSVSEFESKAGLN